MDTSENCASGNESFDGDNNEDSVSQTDVKVIKRRSALERQLETNLTSKITSPANNLISPNTSRYGRARKNKKDEDFYQTDREVVKAIKSPPPLNDKHVSMSPKAVKMNAAKSPLKTMSPQNNIEKKYGNELYKSSMEKAFPKLDVNFTNGHSENIPNQNHNNISTNKQMKVYVRKDLIQNRTEKTSSLMKNMFSPPKNTCLNGSITSPIIEKFTVENGDCNKDISPRTKHAYVDHSGSVVKALDFFGNQTENKKTILERSTFTKNTTNMDSIIAERLDEELCPWKDGDVTWARIGSHPFWPCLITRDPYSKKYLKRKTLGRSTNVAFVLHVTFFADNGRRGWVMSNMLMKFEGLEEFRAEKEQVTPEQRKKDPKYYNAFTVSQNKLRKWNEAVNEAEMILRRPAEYRVDFFNELFSKPDVKVEQSETTQKGSKKKPKSENANISLSESLFDSLFASENEIKVSEKVKNKSRNNSFDVSDVVTACIDDIASKVGNRKIQRQSHMDRWLQKAKSPNKVNEAKKPNKPKSEKKINKSKSESVKAVMKNLNLEMDSRINMSITERVKKLDESKTSNSNTVHNSDDKNNENEAYIHNGIDDSMEVSVNNDELVIQSDVKIVQNNAEDVINSSEDDINDEKIACAIEIDDNNKNSVNKDEQHVQNNDEEVKINGGDHYKDIETNYALKVHDVDDNIKENYKLEKNISEDNVRNNETGVMQKNGLTNDDLSVSKSDDKNVKQCHHNEKDQKIKEEYDEAKLYETSGVNDDKLVIKSENNIIIQGQNNDEEEKNCSEDDEKNNETNVMEVDGVNDDELLIKCDEDAKNNDEDVEINEKKMAKVENEVGDNNKVLRSKKNASISADDSYEQDKPTSSDSESEKEISPKKAGKITKSRFHDPDFQHFLDIRRDGLIDENPDLSEDDVIEYLYKTWLYEETYKTDEMKNDDTQQLVKGLGDETPIQTKKKRKQKALVEKDIETFIPRDKPARKHSVKNYINDSGSSDEELEKKPKKDDMFNTSIEKTVVKVEKKSSPTSENGIKAYFSPQAKKPLESNNEIKVITETEEEKLDFYMKSLTKTKPNLFKGLQKERVCEICETPGNLVKCKGSCSGVFHMDCVKKQLNSPTKEEDSLKKKRGKKKKKFKKTQRKSEDFNEMDITLDNSPEKSTDATINEEENISPNRRMSLTANALDFESQTAIKMQEIMTQTKYDTSDMDMLDSTEDECDWDRMEAGKCEIVDVKLKKKKELIEIQEKSELEKEIEFFKCNSCNLQNTPSCFVCTKAVAPKTGSELRQKCSVAHCGKVYHLECLNIWPQTQFNSGAPSKNNRKISVHYEAITCPRHVCHTCVSDDPRGCKTRFSGDKLARCVRCPATYHSFTQCLPAGTRILTASQIVCPRHYERRPGKIPYHVNTAWCFICASGGTLICCETCPTSFHAECLNISPPEDGYICEDCETGRLPLYGELVWVKLGNYRWWPGLVLHPHEIPHNIMAMKHVLGEFVVRFFGALDHYWVNRGRVFPYQEGDTGHASTKKSAVDSSFILAVQQAAQAYTIIQKRKLSSVEPSDLTSSLLPPHYVKLKVNKPCGTLAGRSVKADTEADSLTQCHCDPDDDEPCGPQSDCLNRMLLTECGAACASEDRCHNRMFEKRQYPSLTPYRTPHRGWGLKTLQDVKRGQFVIEYVGEVIDEQEFRRRMKRKHEIKDENYYFLTLDKDRMIDAGPKGNVARFMNHCCEPNCETQKWTVNGDTRVGLFAIHDIPANTEVTFNYNLECAGVDKKRCLCGAPRCSGYIGAKLKDDPELEKKKQKKLEDRQLKRKNKKKNSTNSPSTSKKIRREKISPPELPIHVTGEDFPITSSPIIQNGKKVMSKEMQEIEEDLAIIRNATNLMKSIDGEHETDDLNKSRVKSSLKNTSLNESDLKSNSLKRKRVSFSSEEIIIYESEINTIKSPQVKVVRLSNGEKNGFLKGKSEIMNGHVNSERINTFTNSDEIMKNVNVKLKGRPKKGLPPPIST